MTQITLNTTITLSNQQLISAIDQLNTHELETLFTHIEALLQQRQQNTPPSPSSSFTQSAVQSSVKSPDTTPDLPIVEAVIPRSLTLDGSDVSL